MVLLTRQINFMVSPDFFCFKLCMSFIQSVANTNRDNSDNSSNNDSKKKKVSTAMATMVV